MTSAASDGGLDGRRDIPTICREIPSHRDGIFESIALAVQGNDPLGMISSDYHFRVSP